MPNSNRLPIFLSVPFSDLPNSRNQSGASPNEASLTKALNSKIQTSWNSFDKSSTFGSNPKSLYVLTSLIFSNTETFWCFVIFMTPVHLLIPTFCFFDSFIIFFFNILFFIILIYISKIKKLHKNNLILNVKNTLVPYARKWHFRH